MNEVLVDTVFFQ